MKQPPFPTEAELTAPGDTMSNRLRQYMIDCWIMGGIPRERAEKLADALGPKKEEVPS